MTGQLPRPIYYIGMIAGAALTAVSICSNVGAAHAESQLITDTLFDHLLQAALQRQEAQNDWHKAKRALEEHRANQPVPKLYHSAAVGLAVAGLTVGGSALRFAALPLEVSYVLYAGDLLDALDKAVNTGDIDPLAEVLLYNTVLPQLGAAKSAADWGMAAMKSNSEDWRTYYEKEEALVANVNSTEAAMNKAYADTEAAGVPYQEEKYQYELMERRLREAIQEGNAEWMERWSSSRSNGSGPSSYPESDITPQTDTTPSTPSQPQSESPPPAPPAPASPPAPSRSIPVSPPP